MNSLFQIENLEKYTYPPEKVRLSHVTLEDSVDTSLFRELYHLLQHLVESLVGAGIALCDLPRMKSLQGRRHKLLLCNRKFLREVLRFTPDWSNLKVKKRVS